MVLKAKVAEEIIREKIRVSINNGGRGSQS